MQIWQAIVLGAVQGFAEFLPISSSGHLMLLQNWFGLSEGAFFYSMALHLGTLIPVIIVLWKNIIGLFKKPVNLLYLVIASIPAGILGFVISIKFDLDSVFAENIWLLSITFLITAIGMMFCEIFSKKNNLSNKICYKTAIGMGLGQMFGVLPGISRSGSTIVGATVSKVDKNESASFTFLMSIPVIGAAILLEVYKCIKEGNIGNVQVAPLAVGVITSAVCGYIAITAMLKFIKKANYKWFSLYLVILSIVNLLVAFL